MASFSLQHLTGERNSHQKNHCCCSHFPPPIVEHNSQESYTFISVACALPRVPSLQRQTRKAKSKLKRDGGFPLFTPWLHSPFFLRKIRRNLPGKTLECSICWSVLSITLRPREREDRKAASFSLMIFITWREITVRFKWNRGGLNQLFKIQGTKKS